MPGRGGVRRRSGNRRLGAAVAIAAGAVAVEMFLALHGRAPTAASVTTTSIPRAPRPATATTLTTAPPTTSASSASTAYPASTARATPATTATPASPHFDTPQAAMTYLADAWNAGDMSEVDQVSNPPGRAALEAMSREAIDLRLDNCTKRPEGDYLCYFDHDRESGGAVTAAKRQMVFLVGPAGTPGWYLTVIEACG